VIDDIRPFEPYPLSHHFPLFEWGLNWIIAMTAHQYLLLHSAALEYSSIGCLFPAMPGSGKSTLCAALAYNGWRLLSDEFGVVEHGTCDLLPMPRVIGLKNQSIPIIREFLPNAVMGPVFNKTRKGDVAHLAPPKSSLERQHIPSKPALIIFPSYSTKAGCRLTSIAKSVAFTKLSNNAFNYRVSMRQGFRSLSQIIEQCDSYTFEYHSLEQAVDSLTELINDKYLR
jgi:HprK-related kinase A